MRLIDLTNLRFGRLVALNKVPAPKETELTGAWWRCRCDCGNETVVLSHNLRYGMTRSCGCLRRERCREGARKYWRNYN